MKRFGVGLTYILLLVVGITQAQGASISSKQWSFEDNQEGQTPSGFLFPKTGQGRPGHWVVQVESDAPSGKHILTQTDEDATDFRFPMAVANEPLLANLQLSVKCKLVSGEVDQACGLVFRYQDENHYYITRANALEQNVRLYKVVKGNRQQFASWDGAVKRGVWHELRVEAQGDHFTIFWNGQSIIDAHDQTFPNAGKVGLWTKADSVTYFDDLSVEPIER